MSIHATTNEEGVIIQSRIEFEMVNAQDFQFLRISVGVFEGKYYYGFEYNYKPFHYPFVCSVSVNTHGKPFRERHDALKAAIINIERQIESGFKLQQARRVYEDITQMVLPSE